MDAGKSTISGVFNGSRLLEIPFYQRAYVWGEEQWGRFLGDMEFVTASKRPYFLGSIILKQASSGNTWSEVSEIRTVIDGQQRLTTMVIFFKALCAKIDADRLFERDFVLETGEVALRHGKYDRQDFEKVVSATGREPVEGSSSIVLAYNYFLKNIDPEKVDRNTIKSNVQFVCIDLTEGEDEQQIFDTINSLGVRLTTAELLKNYFFNRENEQAFKECWEDVFEPTARRGSIGSRRSLPGASSARSSTSSSTHSSRFWSRTRGVASQPRTSSSIRVLRTSSSPTRISSTGTATATRSRFSTT